MFCELHSVGRFNRKTSADPLGLSQGTACCKGHSLRELVQLKVQLNYLHMPLGFQVLALLTWYSRYRTHFRQTPQTEQLRRLVGDGGAQRVLAEAYAQSPEAAPSAAGFFFSVVFILAFYGTPRAAPREEYGSLEYYQCYSSGSLFIIRA